MPAQGTLLGGRYWLDHEIASGGMATVHLGRMIGPGGFSRMVAIKRLHPHLAIDAALGSTLLDEARLAARVQHPSVVSVLDVVASDDELFLIMDYVVGESLSYLVHRAAENGSLPPVPVAVGIMTSVLGGLHAAHEARSIHGDALALVHRDVSPQNVMVGSDGIGRLLDFGIAKAAYRLNSTRDGQLKGKLRYMAPEQLHAGKVDRRADVYAASVVLWEALTGRALFSNGDARLLVHEVLHSELLPPSRYVAGLPEGLDDVVLTGLAREPRNRFATAMEMIESLERIQNPATARVIGAWVSSTASASLAARADLVARIEQGEAANPKLAPPTSDLPTQLEVAVRARNVGSTERTAMRSRRAIVGGGLVGLATVCMGAVALRLRTPVGTPTGTMESGRPDASVAAVEVTSASSFPTELRVPPASPGGAAAEKSHTAPGHVAPSRNCNPPWTFENGKKRFKAECL